MSLPFIGRLRQAYAAEEVTYGTAVVLASANAFRQLDIDLMSNPKDRKPAPDKLLTPDLQRQITHREQASFDIKKALMWPSGVVNTAPELDVFLKHGFGTKKAGTLSAVTTNETVASTTQFTLDTVTGLAVNDGVLINVTGVGPVVRFVTAIATRLVTVAPALPSAPTTGDTVKAGTTYKPATNPASSLVIADYLQLAVGPQAFSRELRGCTVDKIGIAFDANDEPTIQISGPAKTQLRSTAQAQPGAFTTVGSAMPSGILGGMRIGAAAYAFLKANVSLTNEMTVRNAEFGTASASAFYRRGRRSVEIGIDAYVEDPSVLYAPAEAASTVAVLIQCGTTEGQIWAFYSPAVEFGLPSTPDGENELVWSFKGLALGSGAGNNEIYLAQC